jgi:hypothetical protein
MIGSDGKCRQQKWRQNQAEWRLFHEVFKISATDMPLLTASIFSRLHPLRYVDAQQVEPLLESAGGEFAEGEAA